MEDFGVQGKKTMAIIFQLNFSFCWINKMKKNEKLSSMTIIIVIDMI